ncbi:MAG TPA: ATP-binding cassette domain-containing protein [bacterium]|nr:ATP-binding cassette domain-containing protein [bacterium]
MQVELRGITRTFATLRAVDRVSLTIRPGVIHGLLGENGAGKSTLMKILAGYYRANEGTVAIDGEPVRFYSPEMAMDRGIGMLYQEPLDFPNLTVLENFRLGAPAGSALAARRLLCRLAARFTFTFDTDALVQTLSIGERQQLELLRLLARGVRVLILDEPTTAISAAQREKLFAALRQLAEEGNSVLFVTHKLAEAAAICSRVTVLARGRVTGEAPLPCPDATLVRMMFGHDLPRVAKPAVTAAQPRSCIRGLTVADRHLTVRELSLTVGAGEVIGLAGLEGSGQRLLLRAAAGLLPVAQGTITLDETVLTGRGYHDYLDAGVAYLPSDRLGEGLVAALTVAEHVALARRRHPLRIDWPSTLVAARTLIDEYQVKGTPETRVRELSGGNQQRLLLGLLPEQLALLLLEHPTRGLDIESSLAVWERLAARARQGTAIMFASADLEELCERSDRIIVFYAGQPTILAAADASVEKLGALIGGAGRAA